MVTEKHAKPASHSIKKKSAKPRPTPQGSILYSLLMIVVISLVSAIALTAQAWFDLKAPLTNEPNAVLVLNPGENLGHVIRNLEEKGWFYGSWRLRLIAKITGIELRLKAGEYAVTNKSALSLLDDLVAGKVKQHFFTILPGWRWSDLQRALAKTKYIQHTQIQSSSANLQKQLKLAVPFLEGAFYPDTYAYIRGAQDVSILKVAHKKMLLVLRRFWPGRHPNLPIKSPAETLILASIVEKETGLDADRLMIAAVLINRLTKGMRLEVDPTVIFGLGDDFDGDLTRKHLRSPGAYNTYLNTGLTPTPIAYPGSASIAAILQPAISDALFFVARGDGSSQFSATFEEHRTAVKKYQLKQSK